MKFKIGDKVRIVEGLKEWDTGILQDELDELYLNNNLIIKDIEDNGDLYVETENYGGYWFGENQLELIEDKLKLQVRYIDKNITPLEKMDGGDLVDLRVSTVKKNGKTVNFPCEYKAGDTLFFGLGFAMKMPPNKKANVYPRSGMFKNYGFLLTNSVGQIDNSYCGSDNEWKAMVWCTRDGKIDYNDRILQFEVVDRVMENVKFEIVENLEDECRGGYSSTGVK